MTNELAKIIINVHKRAERSERSTQVQRDTVDKIEVLFENAFPTVFDTVSRDRQANKQHVETLIVTDVFKSGANTHAFFDEGGYGRYVGSGTGLWADNRFYYDYVRYAGMLPMDSGSVVVAGGVESKLIVR
jgi:hypothetical protein